MAFYPHLIDALWDIFPAAGPQLRHNIEPAISAEPRPSLQWCLGDGGRLHARWTHARD